MIRCSLSARYTHPCTIQANYTTKKMKLIKTLYDHKIDIYLHIRPRQSRLQQQRNIRPWNLLQSDNDKIKFPISFSDQLFQIPIPHFPVHIPSHNANADTAAAVRVAINRHRFYPFMGSAAVVLEERRRRRRQRLSLLRL